FHLSCGSEQVLLSDVSPFLREGVSRGHRIRFSKFEIAVTIYTAREDGSVSNGNSQGRQPKNVCRITNYARKGQAWSHGCWPGGRGHYIYRRRGSRAQRIGEADWIADSDGNHPAWQADRQQCSAD